jgi:GNAT superfamily N-acetyltransferase
MNDAELIIDFQIRLAKETEGMRLNKETVSKGVRAVLRDKAKGEYFMAEKNGEVVGMMLTIPEWSDWRNGTAIWIHSLYVRPEWRGRGAFKKMYLYLKKKVGLSAGLVGLRLYVERKNKTAHKVYKRLGMNSDHYLMYEWLK